MGDGLPTARPAVRNDSVRGVRSVPVAAPVTDWKTCATYCPDFSMAVTQPTDSTEHHMSVHATWMRFL